MALFYGDLQVGGARIPTALTALANGNKRTTANVGDSIDLLIPSLEGTSPIAVTISVTVGGVEVSTSLPYIVQSDDQGKDIQIIRTIAGVSLATDVVVVAGVSEVPVILTHQGITWTVSDATFGGYDIAGRPFVVVPSGVAQVTSVSPDIAVENIAGTDRTINGLMLNPTRTSASNAPHGLDSREAGYDAALLAGTFPLDVASGDTLMKVVSDTTSTSTRVGAFTSVSCLHVLSEVPTGSFVLGSTVKWDGKNTPAFYPVVDLDAWYAGKATYTAPASMPPYADIFDCVGKAAPTLSLRSATSSSGYERFQPFGLSGDITPDGGYGLYLGQMFGAAMMGTAVTAYTEAQTKTLAAHIIAHGIENGEPRRYGPFNGFPDGAHEQYVQGPYAFALGMTGRAAEIPNIMSVCPGNWSQAFLITQDMLTNDFVRHTDVNKPFLWRERTLGAQPGGNVVTLPLVNNGSTASGDYYQTNIPAGARVIRVSDGTEAIVAAVTGLGSPGTTSIDVTLTAASPFVSGDTVYMVPADADFPVLGEYDWTIRGYTATRKQMFTPDATTEYRSLNGSWLSHILSLGMLGFYDESMNVPRGYVERVMTPNDPSAANDYFYNFTGFTYLGTQYPFATEAFDLHWNNVFPPLEPPVDMAAATTSMRMPRANNVLASETDERQSLLQQSFANNMFVSGTGNEKAFFAIVRLPKEQRAFSRTIQLVDVLTDSSRFLNIQYYGEAAGSGTTRGRFGAKSGGGSPATIYSQPWTEDSALLVYRRAASGNMVLDWYSLIDGTKYAGAEGGNYQAVNSASTAQTWGVGGVRAPVAGDGLNWPGDISAIGYVDSTTAAGDALNDAAWSDIAKGKPLSAALPIASTLWVREFTGTTAGLAKPAWATGDVSVPMTVSGAAPLKPGGDFRKQGLTDFMVLNPSSPVDGDVWSILNGATVTLSGTCSGRTGNAEVRMLNPDGTTSLDWTVISPISGGAFSGTVAVPASTAGWVALQIRSSNQPTKITNFRDKVGAGLNVVELGQSQRQRMLASVGLDLSFPQKNTASYVTTDLVSGPNTTPMQQNLLTRATASDGTRALVNQIRAFWPSLPIRIIDGAVNGTGPIQLMQDSNAARSWAELQTKIDRVGGKLDAIVMNWATTEWRAVSNGIGEGDVVFEALMLGSGPAWDALVAANGGTAGLHSFGSYVAAGAKVILEPATRYSSPLINGDVHSPTRLNQINMANTKGWTVGPPISDFAIQAFGTDLNGPHQDAAKQGNRRMGARSAIGIARAFGRDSSTNPYFTTVVRSGGTLTVSVALPNGGTLSSPAPTALRNWQVDDGGSGTFVSTGFTAAISGNTVILTKTSGSWAAGTKVKYLANGEPRADSDGAAEDAIVAGMLYETWGPSTLEVGLPVMGSLSGGKWVSFYEATAG
ncbi:hypothetical protein SAMN05444339_10296 [Loktanella atrilutea]|uniref:Uncharacterized protein n=1 Tax=Loktanella atrilutea TaxID=366533 RepID=A0A1M4WF99_LOKAT|nr:hypothetical protein [Loktanella atrilutea]SHE79929.1 hypothetical protein SAMN05444339_10296 [Loktanella atrilutea]